MKLLTTPLPRLADWPIEDSIRRLGRTRYLCPPTQHWAGWLDADAVRQHGIEVPAGMTADDVRREILGACQLAAWDAQDEPGEPDRGELTPLEQFETLRAWGGLA